MKKQIFIINGSGGVGKDKFVSLVREWALLKDRNYDAVYNFSSVGVVKTIASLAGWDGGKSEKDRKFLSDLKILCSEYSDLPFNSMREAVETFLSNDKTEMLFLHIREPDEIERAKKEFNAKAILVVRDSVKHITSNMADEGVFNYEYDIIIDNNGDMKSLNNKAKAFYNDFLETKIKKLY